MTVLIVLAVLASSCACAAPPDALEPVVSRDTRLIIFSPHPDDECLGAAGLIQRTLSQGGKVKVVFMTSGDGFPEGVELEDQISHPTAADYRNYGKEREREALHALAVLGVKKRDITFLGFPDGSLCKLIAQYRSDLKAYTSPFTRENHPPAPERILSHTDYSGQDLVKEIVKLLNGFRPNLLATTPSEDQHPDHCATYHFVKEALKALSAKDPTISPGVLAFLIHFGQWPIGQGSGSGSRLDPPDGFSAKLPGDVKWISFPLSPAETETKREAILQYHTQMLVMGRYLLSFARANELFMVDNHGLPEEMEETPCYCQ
jgi:LmbE family N-acetylglucosaminyl deacetylase